MTRHPPIESARASGAIATLLVHPDDDVAVVLDAGGARAGDVLDTGTIVRQDVPASHKVAVREILDGAPVRRYGVEIGRAVGAVSAGDHVHDDRLTLPEAVALDALSTAPPAPLRAFRGASGRPSGTLLGPAPSAATFEGYRNPDGSVGTRNLLAITTTVQCVAGVLDVALERIRRELLPGFPNVDGVVALDHAYGCGVAIDAPDAAIPIRTLRHLALNPNFGGRALVVSLGCEKLQPERLLPPNAFRLVPEPAAAGAHGRPFDLVRLQDERHGGFGSMVDDIVRRAGEHLEALDARRRETVPAAELVVGVQCGGSDAFSGISANPGVGACADLLVEAGATVLFGEVTEVRDCVEALVARAVDAEVAEALLREMAWYDAYLARGGVDRSANTTPGNRSGGLSNIVEKAMGSVVKSGTTPIVGVVPPGERAGRKGLLFAATPASDFVCGTLQLAAGMTVHLFTTGRGTPYALAACPVVKIATRTELARRWHDLMDVDAGRVASGELSVEALGRELFEHVLGTASGRPTCAERLRLRNALVLFNPAPVT